MTTMNNEDPAGCPHPQIIAYAIAADVGVEAPLTAPQEHANGTD